MYKILFLLSYLAVTFSVTQNVDKIKVNAVQKFLEKFNSSTNFPTLLENKDIINVANLITPKYAKNWFKHESLEVLIKELSNRAVNLQCIEHVGEFFKKMLNALKFDVFFDDNPWYFQMIDSWGKVPDGFLSGNVMSLGDRDECFNLEGKSSQSETTFRGRHCMNFFYPVAWLKSENAMIFKSHKAVSVPELLKLILAPETFALQPGFESCLPTSCSMEDVQEILYILFVILGLGNPQIIPITIGCAEKERPDFTNDQIAMIAVCLTLVAVCILSTIVDIILEFGESETFHRLRGSSGMKIFLAFSVNTNAQKWACTNTGKRDISCIHGIRFFSTCWVVLGHTFFAMISQPGIANWVKLANIHEHHWSIYFILNAFFSVDSFFLLSGILACISMLKMFEKTKGNLHLIPKLYLHRLFRLTPTYAFLIGLVASILPLLGNGPIYNVVSESQHAACKANWWTNLLYINNIVDQGVEGPCAGETWYLSIDMQLFILAPFFVYVLWKWEKLGMGILGLGTFLSMLAPGIYAYVEEAEPTQILWKHTTANDELYYKTWFRTGPYVVGLWVGYLLYKLEDKKMKLPPWAIILGWMASTATALGLLLGPRDYFFPNYDGNRFAAAFYAGVSRTFWGVSLGWIIFACAKEYGGWVNRFLSWKVFVPLGRLTFCVYICSLSIQGLYHYDYDTNWKYSVSKMVYLFIGHLVISFMVGFVISMLVEAPVLQFDKMIFQRDTGESTRRGDLETVKSNTE